MTDLLRSRAAYLPAAVAAPFALLFLITALGRLFVPFELEWNEGHSAEQALRFAAGEPLYPPPESGWVPYMYAPLYHMLFGALMDVTSLPHLFWGRLISFAASLAVSVALFAIVREHTRRAAAAALAALLWFAFFRASGFWYDIARNDALAFALGAWGMALTLKRHPSTAHVAGGVALLMLGTLAKQTVALPAFWCIGWLLWKRHPAMRWVLPAAALITLNVLLIFPRTGSTHFWHYTVTNALAHASDWPAAWPRILREAVLPAVPLLAGVSAWLVWCAVRRRRPSGARFIVPVLLLACGALGGYAKFGGFRNNFLPLFMGVVLLAGLAWGDVLRAIPRRYLLPAAIGAALLLAAGLPFWLFNPLAQIPGSESRTAHARLRAWLDVQHEAGIDVLVLHHQWYGLLAGHPPAPNVDMIRTATWAGDPVPQSLIDHLTGSRYELIVTDFPSWRQDWLFPGGPELLEQYYEPAGRGPWLDGLSSGALLPPTGAGIRPEYLFRRMDPAAP